MTVRELVDGATVDMTLLVREREFRNKKDGDEYLQLLLADRTGSVIVKVWDDAEPIGAMCDPGTALFVSGRYTVHHKYGAEIKVRQLRRANDDEIDYDKLLDGPARPVDDIESDLRILVGTVHNEHLKEFLRHAFGAGVWGRFRVAPAARKNHHGYRHGLLEHTVEVAQAVSVAATMAVFSGIDREVAVTAALVHDIGKIDVYTDDPFNIEVTDQGKLMGEIPLTFYRLRTIIDQTVGFPPPLAEAILHIVQSHHGQIEHGSPVVPCTREAVLVHAMDNLSARLGAFDRLEKALPENQVWSVYDRVVGAGAYFPNGDTHSDDTVAAPAEDVEQGDIPYPEPD